MPPKRPAETTKESEEKRQRADESNMDSVIQTAAGLALTIPPDLIETLVSRVADEVTRRLQPQNADPLPSPSSGGQPPRHEPAPAVADPQDKTKSLVEQTVSCVSQSLAGTGFQANGTSDGQFSHTNPTLSAASELQPAILELLSSSPLQKSSLPTYKRSWHLFHTVFLGMLPFLFPSHP